MKQKWEEKPVQIHIGAAADLVPMGVLGIYSFADYFDTVVSKKQ